MKELTWKDAEHVLARNHVGRLACYSPSWDTSYVVPMSYAFHEGSIYVVSGPGKKLEYLREHPNGVCFEVDEITNDSTWITVVATGVFVEVHGPEKAEQEPASVERALQGPLRTLFYGETGKKLGTAALTFGAIRITTLAGRQDSWSWDVDLPEMLERHKVTT